MKKTKIVWQKKDGVLAPAYRNQFLAVQEAVKEDQWVTAEFSNIKKPKSNKQLGFLYATSREGGKCGIYEFMVILFKERHGHLYEVEKFGYTVAPKATIENVDKMMKMFFCIKKGLKEFNKRDASMELMAQYISFLDEFCIQNFGYPIPEAIKKGE